MERKLTLVVEYEGVLRHQVEDLKRRADTVAIDRGELQRFWRGSPLLEVYVDRAAEGNGNGSYPHRR